MSKPIERALISVSNKEGLIPFAEGLAREGVELLSTGGTAKALREAGLAVTEVAQVTGFPEILDGRVKTLHPKIHGGILARRDLASHREQLEKHGIVPIDLVVVNLYPFQQTVARGGSLAEAIENIDIGGPAMLRSAAKNYRDVAVVVNPRRYKEILEELEREGRCLTEETRFRLAVEAFAHTAEYDDAISSYLSGIGQEESSFPRFLSIHYYKVQDLRYGENPQQKAAFYREKAAAAGGLPAARQLAGKPLSFNNLNDLNNAWETVWEFESPAAVAVKHTNPCGVGLGDTVLAAYKKAYEADPVSIFGGILALNREVDAAAAEAMSKIFLEVIAAPSFSPDALPILSAKKDLRLLTIPIPAGRSGFSFDLKKVAGGLLVQEQDRLPVEETEWRWVTEAKGGAEVLADLFFALKVVKHVKSNAIVLARDRSTVGIGAGQMNRVGAARIAIEQAGDKARGAVMASDAFFPFKDTVELAAAAGISAIIQPGGSLRDEESIAACNSYGIAMIFTGRRFFLH